MSCNSCPVCFKQADGTVIKRVQVDGAFVYYLADGTRTSTMPATFVNTTPVDCALYDNQVLPTDHESHIFCVRDANGDATGVQVMAITTVDPITKLPAVVRYNLADMSVWTGDPATLGICGTDQQVESDPTYFCDGAVTFVRWVVKEKGQPTGVTYDTDLAGAPYTPVGTPVPGGCTDQRMYDYENACFRDRSNIDNLTINGSVRRVTNKATGAVTVDYLDDTGAVLPMATYKKVACC